MIDTSPPPFNEEESSFLKTNSYTILNWRAWKNNYPDINKTKSNSHPYTVGIEGTAPDIEGDWGWCRTWRSVKTLEEAINLR
jgi:hypothetical protein